MLPVGISDVPRTSRFKLFCPRCDEVYIPKVRNLNVDGACYGTSFPHVFLKHYPNAVILPPKVFLYEPKIYGFNVVGKRGSKYFTPTADNGAVKYVTEPLPDENKEKRDLEVKIILATLSKPLAKQVEVVKEERKEAKKKRNRTKK